MRTPNCKTCSTLLTRGMFRYPEDLRGDRVAMWFYCEECDVYTERTLKLASIHKPRVPSR